MSPFSSEQLQRDVAAGTRVRLTEKVAAVDQTTASFTPVTFNSTLSGVESHGNLRFCSQGQPYQKALF